MSQMSSSHAQDWLRGCILGASLRHLKPFSSTNTPRTMPCMSNLRLLFTTTTTTTTPLLISPLKLNPKPRLCSSSSSPSFSFLFKPLKTPILCSALSSHPKKPKNNRHNNNNNNNTNNYHSFRRNKSSIREKGGSKMEETNANTSTNVNESVGFNRKRAEGRDNSDRPKKVLQLKVRKLNPVNTISYVQILGTGMDTQDTSPSVLLFFDKQRFIFNAGEGLQRFCTEHKIKLSKIDHVFLSRVCSETAGGLPGLLLTLAGMGDEGMSVNVWGPSDLKYLVDAMKSFIPNSAMVHTRSFGPLPSSNGTASLPHEKFDDPLVLINDEVVKLSAILLRPSSLEASALCPSKDTQDGAKDSSSGRVSSQSSYPNTGSASKPGDIAVVYICELPEIQGKFDPKKAAALGLRPGPKYRELQLGNPVKSDRQDIMVHPSDVLGPSVPGPIVILVDCPTLSHLQELLSKQSLSDYYGLTSRDCEESPKTVNCMIHLSPAHVTKTTEYQNWMSRFGGAQHVMAGHEMRNIEVPILKSSARVAARLNYLCPQFFPAPGFWSLQPHDDIPSNSSASSLDSVTKYCESISAENLLKFHLRPYAQLGLDKSSIPCAASPTEIIDQLLSEMPEIVDASQEVAQLGVQDKESSETKASTQGNEVVVEEPWLHTNTIPSCLEDITREDMEIVLLGTGSSQPSKYRNVSSIFINLFSKGSILFDCGEGTLGQLKRRFGLEGADDAVRSLRCIWISHIHADHHTGLARILALRRDLLKGVPHEPLIVVGPRQLKRYLDAYQRLEDLDMQFLDCRHTTEASLEAFESNEETLDPENPKNFEFVKNGNRVGQVDQNIDSTLFARGSHMQSYWKRPSSPVDSAVVLPILKNLRKALKEAGLDLLTSFPVVHCPQAYGVVLKAADRINSIGKTIPGWKIVYSGDTRPCPELVEASQGATVLIHEATFEDAMVDEAISRNHSTTKEAIEVGDSAGAYRIILTHFSQRYPKIPVFDETHMHKTCIAFDLMSVNLADLPVLPKVLPYLKLLFRDEMVVDESDDMNVVAATA